MNQFKESIDFWYKLITSREKLNEQDSEEMLELLKKEAPMLSSLIMERSCNLSCAHCIFQDEKSSKKISEACRLEPKIIAIASQLPKNSSVIHEGRILRDWHISILNKIKRIRPDLSIGLIDNGTYLKTTEKFFAETLSLDWLDISIDGAEEVHNQQRNNQESYSMAIKGLQKARQYVNQNGRVTALFTATKINYTNLFEAAFPLMRNKLINEFHVTPVGPTLREGSLVMGKEEWKVFWIEYIKTHALGVKLGVPVYIRFYNHEDIGKLAEVVGYKVFKKAFTNTKEILVSTGSISFLINNIRILYVPISICCTETFVIDADATYRLAYCIKYTLSELINKRRGDEDLSDYTVASIKESDSYTALYQKGAEQWWDKFGKNKFFEEKVLFNKLIS